MGKPYRQEIDSLTATYDWAIRTPLDDVQSKWKRFLQSNLLAVGSGGSYTAASLAAYLHEYFTGQFAKAVTPLDAVLSTSNLNEVAVLVLTAGGGNPDVIGAFRDIATREPRYLGTLCSRKESRLADLSREFQFTDRFDFESPVGKDGFLATNSLFATAILLVRLYSESLEWPSAFPKRFSDLLKTYEGSLRSGKGSCNNDLWRKESLIVLHSPSTRAAALDIESKLSEAAIQNVQPVDYRNFAHGRHHWLARRSKSTAVLAFICDEVRDLAEKTIDLLPRTVQTLRVDMGPNGPITAVSAIAVAIRLVGEAGEAADIDPGRPKIPMFGRKIYHLRAFSKAPGTTATTETTAIERKSRNSIRSLKSCGELEMWKTGYRSFVTRITKPIYRGIIFDYDGTLCDEVDRFRGLDSKVARHLVRLIKGGAIVGIATGRGKSVRSALQEALPKSLWPSVVVGYYNGSDIAELADNSCPDGESDVDSSLKSIAIVLAKDSVIQQQADLECRPHQIKIEIKRNGNAEGLWKYVQQLLYTLDATNASLLCSAHSMDIISPGISKQNVVQHVQRMLSPKDNVLCIGDRGRWPGNDCTLLSNPHSLSVDQCPLNLTYCWNIGPPGFRGVQTTMYYLEQIVKSGGGHKLVLKARRKSAK